ncbi:hypothetical protein VTN77DRAFT_3735 [Rasamsonia byssochlamydoides]|uniref:uncharacterized protein n=1 Tax=Rasamsonia byssochlamydoides TaxID=89139 RepID=UPI003743E1A0
MLRPILDINPLNVVACVAGLFILIYGYLSIKIQQVWYLGEALPAFVLGILLGPVGANILDVSQWGGDSGGHTHEIAYGLSRLVIGIQLVKAGYELPKKYQKQRFVEMTICLLPVMTMMWLSTTACIKLMVPKISFVAALIIGSCVTCTDPVLSQAIAKGPFADNYVRRPLREFISSEAGGNDGFGFPFLLLAVSLLRYAEAPANAVSLDEYDQENGIPDQLGMEETGRFGGGTANALKHWAIEGALFMVLLGFAYGAIIGTASRMALNFALKRKWVDNESYLIFPLAIGLFIIGTCGCFGSDETLACFVAGNALNWDGRYLAETHARHDMFNAVIERLLNFGAFMFIGLIMPWDALASPEKTGLTIGRLFGLGFLVLVLRRIPAIMLSYRFMSDICRNWKEALFLGYFGPIGIGAISYVEYARHLFPEPGKSDREINNLTAVMIPVVYWLVFFSIIVHGLSVPVLNAIYKFCKVTPIHDDPVEVVLLSENEPLPNNSTATPQRHSAILNNRFSRRDDDEVTTHRGSNGSVMIEHARHHHYHNHHHLHHRQSLHPSDEFEILRHSEEGRLSGERPTTTTMTSSGDDLFYSPLPFSLSPSFLSP